MPYALLGAACFAPLYLFDRLKLSGRGRGAGFWFLLGCLGIFAASAGAFFSGELRFLLPFPGRLLAGILTLVCAAGLSWALFFALPFSGTYVGQQQSTVVDSGLYALCRHPGVLFFAGMYLCAWLFCGRDAMLLTAVSLTLCDVLHVFVQDRVYFPKTLTGYGDYRRRVPFLIPNAASVRRCIHTLHQKEARRS